MGRLALLLSLLVVGAKKGNNRVPPYDAVENRKVLVLWTLDPRKQTWPHIILQQQLISGIPSMHSVEENRTHRTEDSDDVLTAAFATCV